MFRKISKFLYPSIFKYELWFYQQRDRRIEAERENLELKNKIQEMNRSLSLMKELSQSEDLIVLRSFDERGNILFLRITEEFEGVYDFINVEAYSPLKAIHTECREHKRIAWIHAQKHRGFVNVTDFKVVNENKGIGSFMMRELFKYINYRNRISRVAQAAIRFDNPIFIERIQGELSYVDWGHIDKLKYFYSKLGFEVVTDDSKKKGRIEKNFVMPK